MSGLYSILVYEEKFEWFTIANKAFACELKDI